MKTIPMIASSIALILAAACGNEQPAKTASDTASAQNPEPSPPPSPARWRKLPR